MYCFAKISPLLVRMNKYTYLTVILGYKDSGMCSSSWLMPINIELSISHPSYAGECILPSLDYSEATMVIVRKGPSYLNSPLRCTNSKHIIATLSLHGYPPQYPQAYSKYHPNKYVLYRIATLYLGVNLRWILSYAIS